MQDQTVLNIIGTLLATVCGTKNKMDVVLCEFICMDKERLDYIAYFRIFLKDLSQIEVWINSKAAQSHLVELGGYE